MLTSWIGIVFLCYFFWSRFGGCFSLKPRLFVVVFTPQFGGLRCFTSALLGGNLCSIKRRLQAKLLALEFVQIGSTLVAHFGFVLLVVLVSIPSSFGHLIWYHFEASLFEKLHLLSIKFETLSGFEVASF